MLKRIYVNNFRCLVNFELTVDSFSLFLGANGSGKTAVFDVLRKLQQFILGEQAHQQNYRTVDLFSYKDLTRWQKSPIQTFELDLESHEGLYQYTLEVQHQAEYLPSRMHRECLTLDGQTLFEFWLNPDESNQAVGQAKLYDDNPNFEPEFLPFFDGSRSGIGFIYERHNNQKLIGFKKRITNFFIVQIDPFKMDSESRHEDNRPNSDLSNYAAWYTYLSQEYQGKILQLTLQLQKIIQGFDSFMNTKSGEVRQLSASFTRPSKATYRLSELSHGQKVLIALYTLIYCAPDEPFTLCIDEPENFLALPEIKPWWNQVMDSCVENQAQAILISHHPSLINYLASHSGYWFERINNEAVRVRRITEQQEQGLSIAQLVELGWIYDE